MNQPFCFTQNHFAAGQPSREHLADLAKQGVKSVINLRGPDEVADFDECAEVERLGMDYHALPITGAPDLDAERIRRFGELLDQARAKGGVLIHCASANRAGAMVALDEMLNRGTNRNEALERGRAAGLVGLEPAVVELADKHGIA